MCVWHRVLRLLVYYLLCTYAHPMAASDVQVIESKVEKRIVVVSSVAEAKRISLPRPAGQRYP